MDSESSGNFRINVTVELGQILTRKLAYTVYVPFYFLLGNFFFEIFSFSKSLGIFFTFCYF